MVNKDTVVPALKKVRGSHAGRTKAMRERLVNAAVECLYEYGYGATTFQTVTDRAGVSRGAILHHFPTRIDLMAAVAKFSAEFQDEVVMKAASTVRGEREMFISITRATWSAMIQPPAMALLEIMMASRGDTELAARILALTTDLETRQRDDVWDLAAKLGVQDKHRIEVMVRLHRAAMRGLMLEVSLTGDMASAQDAIDLLINYKRLLTDEMTGPPAS